MSAPATPTQSPNGAPSTQGPRDGDKPVIEVALTVEEARVLRSVAQRGMLAAGAEGAPEGQPQRATAAIAKLAAALEEAETVALVREELEQAGFESSRLSDAQVSSLGRRLAEIPQRLSR